MAGLGLFRRQRVNGDIVFQWVIKYVTDYDMRLEIVCLYNVQVKNVINYMYLCKVILEGGMTEKEMWVLGRNPYYNLCNTGR